MDRRSEQARQLRESAVRLLMLASEMENPGPGAWESTRDGVCTCDACGLRISGEWGGTGCGAVVGHGEPCPGTFRVEAERARLRDGTGLGISLEEMAAGMATAAYAEEARTAWGPMEIGGGR